MSERIAVALETAPKKTFAIAIDWPGWSRSGRTAEAALESLAAYAPRYAPVVRSAGVLLPGVDGLEFETVETQPGSSGTEFGVPGQVTDHDRRPTSAADAQRLAAIVRAAWEYFERVAAAAPAELRKGPRGGGRDTAKIVNHVIEADEAYAREVGIVARELGPSAAERVAGVRSAVLGVLAQPSDGSPLAGRKWTARYAAHRIAWHALDHAWEIEDRSGPA